MINPLAMNTMYIDRANAKLQMPYRMGNCMLRLSAGDLVHRPSWMLHKVLPSEGNGARISIAFLARYMLDGTMPAVVPLG